MYRQLRLHLKFQILLVIIQGMSGYNSLDNGYAGGGGGGGGGGARGDQQLYQAQRQVTS